VIGRSCGSVLIVTWASRAAASGGSVSLSLLF
jgi:hypothetical protein